MSTGVTYCRRQAGLEVGVSVSHKYILSRLSM